MKSKNSSPKEVKRYYIDIERYDRLTQARDKHRNRQAASIVIPQRDSSRLGALYYNTRRGQ